MSDDDKFHHKLEDGREIVLPHFKHVPFGVVRKLRKENDAEQMFTLVEEVADDDTLAIIDTLGMEDIDQLFTEWQEASKVTAGESSASSDS